MNQVQIRNALLIGYQTKYEFVHMIRILRFNKWIIIKDSEVKLHFLLKGKLCQIKHFSIKDTDNLKKIKEILSKHNL